VLTTHACEQFACERVERSKDMMDKIDTDRDGTIFRAEFITYLTKLFDMMDTSTAHKGTLTMEEVMFATGGYNRSP
jgi:hypothetical protein